MKKIVFLGKCGAGKSSAINALFDLNLPTDNTHACTMEINRHRVDAIKENDQPQILPVEVIDTPGFGESLEVEHIYKDMYSKVLPVADVLAWVTQGDMRIFRPDQEALLSIREFISFPKKIIIILNRIDLIGPKNWDETLNVPSAEQRENIEIQVGQVLERLSKYFPFNLTHNDVIPFSAVKKFNKNKLIDTLLNHS